MKFELKEITSSLFRNFSLGKLETRKDSGIDTDFVFQTSFSILLRYIFIEKQEIMTLEGPIIINAKIHVPVLIDSKRKLFYIFSTIKKRQNIILNDLMEGIYNNDYKLECLELVESAIRKIAENSVAIIFSSHKTPTKSPLLNISGAGLDLRETDYWESYGQDPLDLIKISLVSNGNKEIKISFKLSGSIITVHRRNVSDEELIKMCNKIADDFLIPYINSPLIQTTITKFL